MATEDELMQVPGLSDAEKTELKATLDKLDDTLEKSNFHPIVKFTLFNLQDVDGTWFPTMPVSRATALMDAIEETRKDNTIVKAMWDLLRLSVVLWKEMKVGPIALELFAVVDHIIIKHNLVQQLSPNAEVGAAQRTAAKAALGDTTKATAPKLGEKPPVGSVKAGDLRGGGKRKI
ncbi:MAG: hypothetical protein Q8O67_33335 [Deltaproteobacteria bacterium]|nr:hypothetical protein [Deltaproteobacteria bacterium]